MASARSKQVGLLDAGENESVDEGVCDAPSLLIVPARHEREPHALLFTRLSDAGQKVTLVEMIFEKLRYAHPPERQDADGVDFAEAQHSPFRVRSVVSEFEGSGLDASDHFGSNKVGPAESVRGSRLRHLGCSRDVEKC